MRLNALYSGSQEVEGLWEALWRLLKAAVPMPRTRATAFTISAALLGLIAASTPNSSDKPASSSSRHTGRLVQEAADEALKPPAFSPYDLTNRN